MPTRLGVVSDTHGHLRQTQTAVRILAEQQVDQVIHCGDIGSPDVIPLFAPWPTHFVFGNVDHDRRLLREAIERAHQTCHGTFGERHIEGLRIAFLHGDDVRLLSQTVTDGQWDLVCYGHTHRPEWKKVNRTWLLNPGAVYRARPHSVAVVNLPELTAESLTF